MDKWDEWKRIRYMVYDDPHENQDQYNKYDKYDQNRDKDYKKWAVGLIIQTRSDRSHNAVKR